MLPEAYLQQNCLVLVLQTPVCWAESKLGQLLDVTEEIPEPERRREASNCLILEAGRRTSAQDTSRKHGGLERNGKTFLVGKQFPPSGFLILSNDFIWHRRNWGK